MNYFIGSLLAIGFMATALPLHAMPKAEDVHPFILKNGMKVFVLEDHAIPNATLQIFYRVGSRNEYPGITGLTHFLEHMMFNGAKKYGPKMYDRVLENAGGSSNAYTTEDITAYQNWVPKSSLELIFEMEADRMETLILDEKMVESERGVVLSEYTTGYENSDYDLLEKHLRSVAYQAHPYRWPIIGYESDIRNWTRSDVKAHFDRFYAPNNAIAVIVGDVTSGEVMRLATKYLEPLPARPPPRPVYTREPVQRGEKRLVVNKDVSSPHVLIAYHVPETGTADYYALDLLSSILSNGKSSRFYRTLINEKQLATEISTFMPQSLDPTLFYIYAVGAHAGGAKNLEEAILREIDQVAARGVTEKELIKAKNNVIIQFYRSLETISNTADLIGTYEIFFGGYQNLFKALEEYKKVTSADIKTVAARYFQKSSRTIGVLEKDDGK
ncbi:MAG: M16 family metallopeptidase [Syntrophales bacterium]